MNGISSVITNNNNNNKKGTKYIHTSKDVTNNVCSKRWITLLSFKVYCDSFWKNEPINFSMCHAEPCLENCHSEDVVIYYSSCHHQFKDTFHFTSEEGVWAHLCWFIFHVTFTITSCQGDARGIFVQCITDWKEVLRKENMRMLILTLLPLLLEPNCDTICMKTLPLSQANLPKICC